MNPPPRSAVTPAAVSAALRHLMAGPPVQVRVLAAFPEAIYLAVEPADLDPATAAPPSISIVTAGAAAQPGSLILPRAAAPPRCHAGMVGSIGAGRLVLGDVTVVPTRWWAAAPALPPVDAQALQSRARELQRSLLAAGVWDRELHRRADVFARSVLAGDHDAAMRAGRRLLGSGPGLTPSGDDVLSGLLVAATTALQAYRRASAVDRVRTGAMHAGVAHAGVAHAGAAAAEASLAVVREAGQGIVELARQATTALSHGLLWHAVRGHAAGPVAAVLRALAGRAPLERQLPALLAVGSTSGRDLAIGLSTGALLAVELVGAACPEPGQGSGRSLHLAGRCR